MNLMFKKRKELLKVQFDGKFFGYFYFACIITAVIVTLL